jgi:ABC-type uncharacterized transport system permease subunit
LLLFLCMAGFFLLARFFWKFALKHYTSASSWFSFAVLQV